MSQSRAPPLTVGTLAHVSRTRPYLSASIKVSVTSGGRILWVSLPEALARADLFMMNAEEVNCRRVAELLAELGVEVHPATTLEDWWGAQTMLTWVRPDEPLRSKAVASLTRANFRDLVARNVPLPVCFLVPSLDGYQRGLYGSSVAFNASRPPMPHSNRP